MSLIYTTTNILCAATAVGMYGLLASQSCYHSVLPPSLCTLWAVVGFFISKQTSLSSIVKIHFVNDGIFFI